MVDKRSKERKEARTRKSLNPSGKLRLTVFRSNKHILAQIIDDRERRTLIAASDLDKEIKEAKKGLKKMEIARKVGELLAQKADKIKIKEVVFDRGYLRYHGRIKALAEGARTAGLKF